MHSEHCHHAIALHARDKAATFMDRVNDDLHRAIKNVARVFRVERADKPGGPDDIGKQDGGKADGVERVGQSLLAGRKCRQGHCTRTVGMHALDRQMADVIRLTTGNPRFCAPHLVRFAPSVTAKRLLPPSRHAGQSFSTA